MVHSSFLAHGSCSDVVALSLLTVFADKRVEEPRFVILITTSFIDVSQLSDRMGQTRPCRLLEQSECDLVVISDHQ